MLLCIYLGCSRAQNIGQKATELIKLIPDIKVDVIERCSGHENGSWVSKKIILIWQLRLVSL